MLKAEGSKREDNTDVLVSPAFFSYPASQNKYKLISIKTLKLKKCNQSYKIDAAIAFVNGWEKIHFKPPSRVLFT